jgi:hypothetical protein
MRLTLNIESLKAINDYSKIKLVDWLKKYSGQIIIATCIINWTSEVTNVKNNIFNKKYFNQYLLDFNFRLFKLKMA